PPRLEIQQSNAISWNMRRARLCLKIKPAITLCIRRCALDRRFGRMPWSKPMHDHHNHTHAQSGNVGQAARMAKDPVCGMSVDPGSAKHSAEYGGHTYCFCSQGCKTKFVADPVSYIGEGPKPPAPVPEGAMYTCPMHPEMRQTGPGNCPICGMALEPVVASADSGPNPELTGMTRRFWIALALSLPVVVLEMGGHLFDLHMLTSQKTSNWVQFGLATPVVLWAGW